VFNQGLIISLFINSNFISYSSAGAESSAVFNQFDHFIFYSNFLFFYFEIINYCVLGKFTIIL
jgi:hypothetical protein